MKSIKKLGKTVAASALLVGATLTAGAGLATAQSSGSSGDMTLGDYPMPFVDEDGNVDTSIVVGESAKTADVVGAIEIAGSLGNAAFTTETKSVSVSGAGGSWTATNGVTLDTRNDNLFFGDAINSVRDTLTQSDLSALEEHTFRDDGGTSYDITQYLNVDNQQVSFGNSPDGLDDDDPIVHVPVPSESEVSNTNYLIGLQANMETVNFTESDVKGEEIQLFGKQFTVSESDNSMNDDQLVLYGSSQSITVETGKSKTITVDGTEHTIEVNSVSSSSNAAVTVDGEISSESVGDTINVDGKEIRIDEIINTGASDDGKGIVQFDVGSEKLFFEAGEPIQDDDGDDIEGTYVTINGNTGSYQVGDGVSSLSVYLGASNDTSDYLAAGDSWSHSMFPDFEVQVGGLNPNAKDASKDDVEAFEVSGGDEDVSINFKSDSGQEANINFAHRNGKTDTTGLFESNDNLGDKDNGDTYVVQEGETVGEDDYVAVDAGEFSHLYEVTSIDRDTSSDSTGDYSAGDEATISLQDTVTGDSVEVELDLTDESDSDVSDGVDDNNNNDFVYEGTEIIDGQTYHFELEPSDDDNSEEGKQLNDNGVTEFAVTWGTDASGADTATNNDNLATGATSQGRTTLYAPLDTASGSAVAFTDNRTVATSDASGVTYELPSTQSTDAATVTLEYDVSAGDNEAINSTSSSNVDVTEGAGFVTATVNGGQMYNFTTSGQSNVEVAPYDGSSMVTTPAAVAVQPEDDSDNEEAWLFTVSGFDKDDSYDVSGSSAVQYSNGLTTTTLDSDSDVEQDFTTYGSFLSHDTGDQGDVNVHIPYGQSTAGVAITGEQGSISAEAGGTGAVETMSPTGWPSVGMLDSEVTSSDRQNSNMILVGGPAVNTLVSDLAEANKTMTASEYTQGQGMVQLVEDAFSQGNHALVVAGYAAGDTTNAANFISNYEQHQDRLAGKDMVTLTTGQTTS